MTDSNQTVPPTIIPSSGYLNSLLRDPVYSKTREEMEKFDFVVRSDGSAIYDPLADEKPLQAVDDFGGFACFTASVHRNLSIFDFGMATCMNTNCAELTAFILGLRRIHKLLKDTRELSTGAKVTVLWLGDRENLTEAIGVKTSRKSDVNLWSEVAYYEKFMDITGRHVDRDVGDVHAIMDRVSHDLRNACISFSRAQCLRL